MNQQIKIILYTVLFFALYLFAIGDIRADDSSGLFITIGAGTNTQLFGGETWNDADSTGAFLSASYHWNPQAWLLGGRPFVHLTHLSQFESGPPFNDEIESSVDHIGIAVSWRVWH